MKNFFRIVSCTLIALIAMTACKKSNDILLPESLVPEVKEQNEVLSESDSLISEDGTIQPGNDSILAGESYIKKEGRYYKLNTGLIYLPYNRTENTVRVMIRSYFDYFLNYNSSYPGQNNQNWRQNGVILQFQFKDLEQFNSKTYRIVPSEVNTGYSYQFAPTEQAEKFPNDSLCIGFYHIAADATYIEWMSIGYSYGFTDYFVLQSGELVVLKQSSIYEFSGKFKDSQGKEVIIKFNATGPPIEYND